MRENTQPGYPAQKNRIGAWRLFPGRTSGQGVAVRPTASSLRRAADGNMTCPRETWFGKQSASNRPNAPILCRGHKHADNLNPSCSLQVGNPFSWTHEARELRPNVAWLDALPPKAPTLAPRWQPTESSRPRLPAASKLCLSPNQVTFSARYYSGRCSTTGAEPMTTSASPRSGSCSVDRDSREDHLADRSASRGHHWQAGSRFQEAWSAVANRIVQSLAQSHQFGFPDGVRSRRGWWRRIHKEQRGGMLRSSHGPMDSGIYSETSRSTRML